MTGPSPVTEWLLKLYEARAAEQKSQLDLQLAQARTQTLGRTAVPDVMAQLQQRAEREAKRREQTARQGERAQAQAQAPAGAMVPPTIEPTGLPQRGSPQTALANAGQLVSAVSGGGGIKRAGLAAAGPGAPSGAFQPGPQGAPAGAIFGAGPAAGVAGPLAPLAPLAPPGGGTIVQPGGTTPGGATPGGAVPVVPSGQTFLPVGEPGSLVPIQRRLTGIERAARIGFGGAAQIIEGFTGKETLDFERLPTTDELAGELAVAERAARDTGNFAGWRSKAAELQRKYPQHAQDIQVRASVMAQQQAALIRRERATVMADTIPRLQQAGMTSGQVRGIAEAYLENRQEDVIRLMSEFQPGVTEAEVRELEFQRLRLQVSNERIQQKFLTRAMAAQDEMDQQVDFYESGWGSPSPYRPQAIGGAPGGIGGGGRGLPAGQLMMSQAELGNAIASTLDKEGNLLVSNVERGRMAARQQYYTDPRHPAIVFIPSEELSFWPDKPAAGPQELFTGQQIFENYAVVEGAMLPEAVSVELMRVPVAELPEGARRYAGQEVTREHILADPRLEEYATSVQLGYAGWFRQRGYIVDELTTASGRVELEVMPFDTLDPQTNFQRANGHLNEFLEHAKGRYERAVHVGGVAPLVVSANIGAEVGAAAEGARETGRALVRGIGAAATIVPKAARAAGAAAGAALEASGEVALGAIEELTGKQLPSEEETRAARRAEAAAMAEAAKEVAETVQRGAQRGIAVLKQAAVESAERSRKAREARERFLSRLRRPRQEQRQQDQ